MAGSGSGLNPMDHESYDLQSRRSGSLGRTHSTSSSIGTLSFGLRGGFSSEVNGGSENENVFQIGEAGDRALLGSRRHSGASMPLSVESATDNGVIPGQLRENVSVGRASSSGASLRRLFSLSAAHRLHLDEDVESEIISQAGDAGERALSRRGSLREGARISMDQGVVFPIPEELLESYGFWSHDPSKLNPVSPVSPLASEIVTSPSTAPILHGNQEEEKELSPSFEYVACLIHLAAFGILGVITRYLLQKLFGPSVAHVTSDQSILYVDLPSNMVGSFLMGWLGVVFKANIARLSDQLAIGLSTGYLGSLTTFSGWNQKMLDLSVKGHWVSAVLGFLIGLFLAAYSIIFGVETAKGFRWLLKRSGRGSSISNWRVDSYKRHLIALLVLMLMWIGLWVTSGTLERKEFKDGGSEAQLWLACFFGPLGVWIRWWLARLNGRGLGKAGFYKWIPFGTLAANVSAACVMAALATVKKAVNTKNCDTVANGVQFGLMGCLSTVSTFMAEFNAMRQSSQPWRAYAYAIITIGVSFVLGTLIYSVPVWAKGYN